jgi:23S rRNA (uracil1939-C5)-methyltransferase
VKFEISPLSFYQVNAPQAKRLYDIAEDFAELDGNETLLDLYCGAGTIGLYLAKKVKSVIGVEVVPEAVEDAKRNAAINGINNARFICADAGKAAKQLNAENSRPDVVVVDPPRKGCDLLTIESVVQMAPERVVYVSCDPATLARDLKIFAEKGYRTLRVKPVDMFPRTPHVECVALMTRCS